MDRADIVRRRFYSQRLAGERHDRPEDVVGGLVAMQGQEYAEAKWSVAQRCKQATDADVEAAYNQGRILRTHLLRPTWHLVTQDDIRSLLLLTAPRVHQASGYMYRQLGLEQAELGRSADYIYEALANGPLTRPQLAERLSASGFDAVSLRLVYLMMNAELEGVICSGPRRGKQHTYVRLEDRVPMTTVPERDQALADLARRYFVSRGPVTVRDFAYWSGLTLGDARAGLEMVRDDLTVIVDDNGVEWLEDPELEERGRLDEGYLIATYDEMIMSYKDLKVILTNPDTKKDLLQRPVIVDGITVGSWRRSLAKESVTVEVQMFDTLRPGQGEAIEAAVGSFGRFLGLSPSLTWK